MPRAVAVLIALVAFLGIAARAQARGPFEVGISDDRVLLRGGPAADAAVARWSELGVDAARVQVSWARVAPAPRARSIPAGFNATDPTSPLYDWQVVDQAVNRLVAAGIQPILMIDGPPPLWASLEARLGNPRRYPSAARFAAFASAVARRYAATVDDYILWNEPNLPLWLQPQASCVRRRCRPVAPDTYRAMVRAAYPAIHAADPTSTVLIGALGPKGSHLTVRNADMRPLQFLRALGCVDARLRPIRTHGCRNFKPAIADGFAYHAHAQRNAPDQPFPNPDDADLYSLPRVERLLDRLQRAGRIVAPTPAPLDIWIDEYGYQTNPPDKREGVSPVRQDRYLQQGAYMAWRDPRVRLLSQYVWRDEPVGGGRRFTGWQSGLLFGDGAAKPALAHFADPFWLDVPRRLLWGQVRPGGAHQVVVQRRLPGPDTTWEPDATVGTAADGTWTLQTDLVPYASYRAVSDDGETTAMMVAAPPPPQLAPARLDGLTSTGRVDRRTVTRRPGAAIPPSFAGLSIEYWAVRDYLGSHGRVNPLFARLTQTLAATGAGAPTLRFGGNSTDETWWDPSGARAPHGIATSLTPSWLGDVARFAALTRTPMVLGVNLGLGRPADAARFAHAAATTLPPGTFAGIEIGNEPDLYGEARTFRVGRKRIVRSRKRPPGYSYPQYRSELPPYVAALQRAAPGVPLSDGSFAGSAWEDFADDLLSSEGAAVPVLNAHAYALDVCSAANRRAGGSFYRPVLLGPSGYLPTITRMSSLAAVAKAHGAALRITEANTADCGGEQGVSDAFASALWGVDMLFGLAEAGVSNVDFHTWTGSFYAPVDFVRVRGGLRARVRPLFYAMLLFDRAAPAGARLLPVSGNLAAGRIKTWATVDPAGTRRVVLVNKNGGIDRTVVLRVPGGASGATLERLTAPSLAATSGIRLGGRGYGALSRDGRLHGRHVVQRLTARGGAFVVRMPAASAALLTVPSG